MALLIVGCIAVLILLFACVLMEWALDDALEGMED